MTNTRMLQDPGYDGILFHYLAACEQASYIALRGPLSAGQKIEGELATMSLKFEFSGGSLCQLTCQISADQCKAEMSANVKKNII